MSPKFMYYQKLIERFDRPETFFYIDPPYYGCENDYSEGIFGLEDFTRGFGMFLWGFREGLSCRSMTFQKCESYSKTVQSRK